MASLMSQLIIRSYLKGCSSNQKSMINIKHANCPAERRIFVLDSVGFVDDQISPLNFGKLAAFLQYSLVRCYNDVPLVLPCRWIYWQVLLLETDSFVFGTTHANRSNDGAPLFDFSHPITFYDKNEDSVLFSLENKGCLLVRQSKRLMIRTRGKHAVPNKNQDKNNSPTTDLGTITICGPLTPRPSRR